MTETTHENELETTLAEVVAALADFDFESGAAGIAERLPFDGELVQKLRVLVRAGVQNRTLADKEHDGVRFGRIRQANDSNDYSIDCVHMNQPGPGHSHPNGEIDLCFAVEGSPTFDGNSEGWTVYPPGSWHVPTVTGGVMDILYFLPGGAIRFEAQPF